MSSNQEHEFAVPLMVRVSNEMSKRIDDMVPLLPKVYAADHPQLALIRTGKSTVLRMAIAKGLEQMEKDAVAAGLKEPPDPAEQGLPGT